MNVLGCQTCVSMVSPKPTFKSDFKKLGPKSCLFITVSIVSDHGTVTGLEKRDKKALKIADLEAHARN